MAHPELPNYNLDPRLLKADTDLALASELKLKEALERLEMPRVIYDLLTTPSQVTTLPIGFPAGALGIELLPEESPLQFLPTARICHHIGAIDTPTKGGIRVIQLSEGLTEQQKFDLLTAEAIALSRESLIKVSIINFPLLCTQYGLDPNLVFGGGAKGIIGVPQEIYRQAQENNNLDEIIVEICRIYGYTYGLRDVISPTTDSVAPDMGTYIPGAMDALYDGYKNALGVRGLRMPDRQALAVVTCKSIENGGTPARLGAVGYGAIIALEKALETKNQSLQGKRIVIDGCGNAALSAAIELIKRGATVIGISDSSGHCFFEEGLDIQAIKELKRGGKRIKDFTVDHDNVRFIPPEEKESFLATACDVLILASEDCIVNNNNFKSIKPRDAIVVEISNLGVTPLAIKHLYENGVEVIPSIIASCGGLVASWLEWYGNLRNTTFSLELGNEIISDAVGEATSIMLSTAGERNLSWTEAAYLIATQRAADIANIYALQNRLPQPATDSSPVVSAVEDSLSPVLKKFLERHKNALKDMLPTPHYPSFLIRLNKEIEKFLENRRSARTFTMLTAMDSDSLATFLILRELYPNVPISLVYPRMRNEIDRQRQGRRDKFIHDYKIPVLTIGEINQLQKRGEAMPAVALYEFWLDGVVDEFNLSSGLAKPVVASEHGLLSNNALGTLVNNYWKLVANATHGITVGTLNATSLRLGDFYRFALDGEIYPLAALFRSDIDTMLKDYFKVPQYLRSVSPWQQKIHVRGKLAELDFSMLARQISDQDVALLPRTFYRIADNVLYERMIGVRWEKILKRLWGWMYKYYSGDGHSEIEMRNLLPEEDKAILKWMIEVVEILVGEAESKFDINKDRFALVSSFAVIDRDIDEVHEGAFWVP